MIQYSLEVAICWSVLFLIYICFLKRETFFSINRGYLLSSLVIGLVIPLLRMIDWHWQEEVVLNESLQFIAAGPSYIATSISSEPINESSLWSVFTIVLALYWIGVAFMASRLFKGIYNIYVLYRNGHKTKKEGFTLVETHQFHLPFSFLNCVFFSKELTLHEEAQHIIKHELTHIKSRHSYDVFFVEILHVLFWWNPLIYLYKRELRQLHEYLADAMVLTGTNQKIYGQILLGQSESGLEIALTHQFFHSHLKQRIMMMYKQKSKRPAMIKYLVALPVILLLGVLFSFSYSNHLKLDPNLVHAEMDDYFSKDTVSDWEQTHPSKIINGIPQEQKSAFTVLLDLLKKYPKQGKIITQRFSYEASLNGINLSFNDNTGKYFCMGTNPDLQRELNTLFNNELSVYDKETYYQVRADLKEKNPDFYNLIEDRFHFEINKRNHVTNQNFTTDTIPTMPPPPPPPKSPEEIAALIKSPSSQHKIFLDGKEITKQEFLEKESSIFLRTYTPIEQTDDQFILPEMHGSIFYRTVDLTEPFKVVEQMPRFPGCENMAGTASEKEECAKEELLEYIYSNLKYPEEARKNNIEGITVIQFIINEEGTLDDIRLARDIGGGAGEAARQIVESMNEKGLTWTPGIQKGEKVKVLYTLPVKFKLEGDSNQANAKTEETNYLSKSDNNNQATIPASDKNLKLTNQDTNKLHYVIYSIQNSDDANVKTAKKTIIDFHHEFFGSEQLKISSTVLNERENDYLILVRKFNTRQHALQYLNTAEKHMPNYLSKYIISYDMFAVTQNSYREIISQKSIDKFKSFYDINSTQRISKKLRNFDDLKNAIQSPLYAAIKPLREQFQGSFPLTIVNGNKYEGYSVNFYNIDITEDQIQSVEYLSPTQAKSKYGDIAFHGALEIQLNNITEAELEKIGKIISPGSQVLSIADREEIFKVVEQMPRFPDCENKCVGATSIEDCHKEELLNFIYTHLVYPEEARQAGIEGVAVVQFIIDKTGTVIEPNVVRDIGGGTAKEVMYVVELMNNLTKKWTPGYQKGQAVNVLYTLPIRFKLEDDKQTETPRNNVDVSQNKTPLIGYELMQNKPNPVSEETIIEFQLPEAAQATLRFYNVQGKTVFKITDQFSKSINVVKIQKDDLKASGVIYYELESGTFKSTRKMVVL